MDTSTETTISKTNLLAANDSLDKEFRTIMSSHIEQRNKMKEFVDVSTGTTSDLAEELENNIRACLGIEFRSIASNQRVIETSLANLHGEVKAIGKATDTYGHQYVTLAKSLEEIGSLAVWLRISEDVMRTTGETLDHISTQLTVDDTVQQ